MKIKPPHINIPTGNPFAEDTLKRAESAEILTQLISTINEPFVLGIDSVWGTGKTTFLKMWLQYLKNSGYPCLYFNAWENYFSDDPMVSLMGELELGFDSIVVNEDKKDSAKRHLNKAKKVGATLIKNSLPAAIKLATSGLVDPEKLSAGVIMDISENLAKGMIKKYEKDKTTIKDFRKRLGDFVNDLTDPAGDDGTKPLVLFIDELDRCRPTYALELLEKAKHFFNVNGIIFVLAIDKLQIGNAIRSVYGTDMDVDGYLRRFIDLDYNLPEPNTEAFCNALFNKFGFQDYFDERSKQGSRYDKDELMKTLSRLFTIFGLTLRAQEQCFARLSIVFRTTKPNYKLFPLFLAALVVLKAVNHELYTGYINGTLSADKVLSHINNAAGDSKLYNDQYALALEAYFAYGQFKGNEIDSVEDEYKRKSTDGSIPKEEQDRASEILRFFKSFDSFYMTNITTYLAKKIDVAERFI